MLNYIKMNGIVNKFLLAGDKFMPEMHIKQPGFTHNTCGPFTKNKDRIQKSKEREETSYIYKNELNKACLQYDMAYGDFKDIARRTASDKFLRDNAILLKIPTTMDIKKGLLLSFANFSIKCQKVVVLIHH